MDIHNDMGTLFAGLVGLLLVFTLLLFLLTANARFTGNVISASAGMNPLAGTAAIVAFAIATVYTANIIKKF